MSRFLLLVYLTIGLISAANAANYCGTSRLDATKCQNRCPSGDDFECSPNESCYSDVHCASVSMVSRLAFRPSFPRLKHVRVNGKKNRPKSEPKSGQKGGQKSEQKDGQKKNLFGRPRRPRRLGLKYCGTSREDATKCQKRCLLGLSFECPKNESCFSYVQYASDNTEQRRWALPIFKD